MNKEINHKCKIFTEFEQIRKNIIENVLYILKFRVKINKRLPNVIVNNNQNFIKYFVSMANIIHYMLISHESE